MAKPRSKERLVSEEAGQQLLSLARNAVERWLRNAPSRMAASPHSDLEKFLGLFVTLRKGCHLRGCIGQLESEIPAFRLVEELALASASRDPRFPPLALEEWPEVSIEISVLSPMRGVRDIREIEIGRHGVYVKKGGVRGVYLPEVAVDQGWEAEEFVRRCAQEKAGMSGDQWKKAEIYLFSTQVFEEPKQKN